MRGGAHRLPRRRRTTGRLALLVVVLCITATTSAWGYWTGSTAAGGSGATAATTVNAGATPTPTVTGQAVALGWASGTLANGRAVTGYLVRRYDAGTQAVQTVGAGCASVTSTSCTENNVPPGSWRYSITPLVGTHWRGAESARSTVVTVAQPDTTPPVNALSLSVASGDASITGATIHYRGVAAGRLRVSNALSDSGSGPANSSTGGLTGTATGWSHTGSTVSSPAGGPFVSNPFSWTAGTTSTPQVVLTGRDAAGNSTPATLSFVEDSTAPTGSVTYVNGAATSRSVGVTFSATDNGSGLAGGAARLQRQGAALTNGTCGSYGAFVTIATAPASPYVDTNVAEGRCYKYQYVVSDKVGNTSTATSANEAKVDYASAIGATPGLVSHWRLGEPVSVSTTVVNDTFSAANWALMTSRAGELGATWQYRAGLDNQTVIDGRVFRNGAGHALYQASGVPASADYAVEADLHVKTALAGDRVGVVGRLDPSAMTYYLARWEPEDTSWNIIKVTGGNVAYLDYEANQGALTPGATYRIRLEISGTTSTSLKLLVNGVEKAAAIDSTTPLTAAGRVGFLDGDTANAVNKGSTTGIHLDNFKVLSGSTPRAADSKGTNTGDYRSAPTLGVAGALAGDTNTAARFDGVDDHVQVLNSTGIPVGSASRTVEAWFKTSSTSRQVIFAYGSMGTAQQYALWLDAGGTTMTAWGWGAGNDIVFTMPKTVTDGSWHHVAQSFSSTGASTGNMTVYIDGVALPSRAVTRTTVMNATYGMGIGAVTVPGDPNSGGYFNGSLDEVALYNTALSAGTIVDHYQLGSATADTAGPTGGAVSATGLVGTGSSYSTSTTLTLSLAKGTDATGVATSGAELWRSAATLTNGTCGTFGGYTRVAGGTDPASPKSDTVADDACYRYEYRVPDVLGNTTDYVSQDVKVDTTAPSAPNLAFSAFTNTAATGSTIHYRSAAANGSFSVTPTSSDATSGVRVFTVPTLGSGWIMTPAGGTATYSWTGSPAAPGTKGFTATNNADLVSPSTDVTFVADDAAPTGSTVGYGDATTTDTTVSVAFTTGTDSGSGIDTRLLQRDSAPLTGTTCGAFSGTFTTIAGGNGPAASPVVDTVTSGRCYKYQYVVSDRVGNRQTATSANVVRVTTAGTGSPSTNLALGRPVTVTSTETVAYAGTNAVDGNAGTRWASAFSDPQSITVDLGSLQNIARVRLQWEAAHATAYTIQTSTDGTTFSDVRSVTGGDGGIDDNTGLGAVGRYVRILGTARATAYGYSLWELEVYGSTEVVPYAGAVNGTAGLVHWFRLGEAASTGSAVAKDSFSGAAGATLQSRTGEHGATWTRLAMPTNDPGFPPTANAVITDAGRMRKDGTSTFGAVYHSSGVPTSADYTVSADVHVRSVVAHDFTGVAGRLDPANPNGTFYWARYESSGAVTLFKVVNGVHTYLAGHAQTLAVGSTTKLSLDMSGTTIRVLVDGVQRISVVDASIAAAGRGGLAIGFGWDQPTTTSRTTTITDTTGVHLDSFRVAPAGYLGLLDSKGTNHGEYHGGVTLGVAGALTGDTSTAATFDGVDDHASFSRQVADDFSIEFWFRSSQGIGTGTQWFNGAGLVDGEVTGVANDFGVSLRSDGRVVAGVGNADTSIVSANGGYHNGLWHHVVFTRTRATGRLHLYVDGVETGNVVGNTLALTGPAQLNLGRLQTGVNHFAGSLDEVAVYNTALAPGTVSAHHAAR